MIVMSVVFAVALWAVCTYVATHLWSAYLQGRRFEQAWIDFFAFAAQNDGMVPSLGIDSDWVAFRLMGLPLDTKLSELPADQQADVLALSERLVTTANELERRGIFHRPVPSFDCRGKDQKILAPRKLFQLTPAGVVVILRRRASGVQAEW